MTDGAYLLLYSKLTIFVQQIFSFHLILSCQQKSPLFKMIFLFLWFYLCMLMLTCWFWIALLCYVMVLKPWHEIGLVVEGFWVHFSTEYTRLLTFSTLLSCLADVESSENLKDTDTDILDISNDDEAIWVNVIVDIISV